MKKSRTNSLKLIIVLMPIIVIVLGLITWVLMSMFEGEKPMGSLDPLPEYLSNGITFQVKASDQKSGLRSLQVTLKQDGLSIPVVKKDFHYEGLFNKAGVHEVEEGFTIDPKKSSLVQGRATLVIEIRDFSKRSGGDGNLMRIEHKMMVDTIPPSINALTRSHNVSKGGACLIAYRTSLDTSRSGVFVDDLFFPGVPYANDDQTGTSLCYFTVPYDLKKDSRLYLWAQDKAENKTKKGFSYHIRQKRFRTDRINLSERTLDAIITSFSPDLFEAGASKTDRYLIINRDLRTKNNALIQELCRSPIKEKLWEDSWLRMRNAATMATFGDARIYYYKGKIIDKAVHKGVDLASLAGSPVQAANGGRVIFAEDLGIYGLAVIIDHGQGLYTLYGHLSNIDVAVDQPVTKGDKIGNTGSTGLATGDHLHFGFLVHGIAVNPIEWWDLHWIKDNIYRKLTMVENQNQR